MEQPAQTQPEQTGPNTQPPAPPAPTAPPQTPAPQQTNVSAAGRKRKLSTRLAIIGALCVSAPVWGIFILMAAADSTEHSSGAAKALAAIVAYLPILAPLPGIGLLIGSLVLRVQAKKLAAGTPSGTPQTPLTASSSTGTAAPYAKRIASSFALPGILFAAGAASFVLTLIVGYVAGQNPGNDIFPEIASLLMWVSIGFIVASIIKAFSKDKKPPLQ